jgi:hypothetical protein
MAVPYTFATATGSLPLSQLDSNFATGIVIGNTTVSLGDTITTINNLTLANVTVTSASFSNVTLSGTTTVSGNTTVFSGTGARIQGDFSNATLASRTAFQDKTTNGPTGVSVLPNGSNATSAISLFNNSDPTNAAYSGIAIGPGNAALISANTGSGTALPLNIYVGNGAPEVARFATDGTFFVGATSVYNGGLVAKSYFSSSAKALTAVTTDSTGSGYTAIAAARQNSDGSAIELWRGSSIVGQVQVSPSGTTYGTISDYRLKNNPQTLTGSGAFIDALQPKTWTWAAGGATGVGFIAHEVAVVSPSSVSGEKDAVNADGTPKYQGMEYGSAEFIANIVAELQSLRTRVAALEAA